MRRKGVEAAGQGGGTRKGSGKGYNILVYKA